MYGREAVMMAWSSASPPGSTFNDGCPMSSFKLAAVGAFIPWKSATATNQSLVSKEPVVNWMGPDNLHLNKLPRVF